MYFPANGSELIAYFTIGILTYSVLSILRAQNKVVI